MMAASLDVLEKGKNPSPLLNGLDTLIESNRNAQSHLIFSPKDVREEVVPNRQVLRLH